MTAERSDEELAVAAAEGDASAFDALVRKHGEPLLAFCRHVLGDRASAEDQVQEAFIRAHRNLGRFDPTRRFSSWLYKIAQNACMDALRRHKGWEPLDERVPDRDREPFGHEHVGALDAALATLPAKYRVILHHKYRLGLNAREIAELLDLTPEDVRISLHRAIKLLRERLVR